MTDETNTAPPTDTSGSHEASMLRILLAVILGDGGHYEAEHGLEKALTEAETVLGALKAKAAEVDALTEQLQAKVEEAQRLEEHLALAKADAVQRIEFGQAQEQALRAAEEALAAKTTEAEGLATQLAELTAEREAAATATLASFEAPGEDRVCDLWVQAGGTAKDFVQAQAFAKLLIEG